jgi:hypothetical protein
MGYPGNADGKRVAKVGGKERESRVMARRIVRFGIVLTLMALPLVLAPDRAAAHDWRDVADGRYQIVIGFLIEPALQNQPNGIDLRVTDNVETDATGKRKPIEGLEQTLQAEAIAAGDGTVWSVPLVVRDGMPGKYAGYFTPTEAGQYTFHIFGTIADQAIDERFDSGPGRFDDVTPADAP